MLGHRLAPGVEVPLRRSQRAVAIADPRDFSLTLLDPYRSGTLIGHCRKRFRSVKRIKARLDGEVHRLGAVVPGQGDRARR